MAVLGINCTKKAIYVAEVDGSGNAIRVTKPWEPIACSWTKPVDILPIYSGVKPVLEGCKARGITRVVVLACASGAMGADNDTVKIEGIVELAAVQLDMTVEHVTPQGVRIALGCAKGEKWQNKSRALLDPRSAVAHWTEGMGGAIAAVWKATMPPGSSKTSARQTKVRR